MAEILYCTSCGTGLVEIGYTVFKCPNCGKATIARCRRCRNQSVEYKCPECGFVGP